MLENIKMFGEILTILLGTVIIISTFFIVIDAIPIMGGKIERLLSKIGNGKVSLSKNEILKALPPSERLELLAGWIDALHPNDKNTEVQDDLRTWAKNLRKLKEKLNKLDN